MAAARTAMAPGSPWMRLSPADRMKLIWRIGDLIDRDFESLAVLESLDNGKTVAAARGYDVPTAREHFYYMSGWAARIEGRTVPVISASLPARYHAYTRREPVGVCGQITPWNFPLQMAAWKLAPALAAGCAVVLKPAEQTPLTAVRLVALCAEAGVPAGVVNLVTGFGETAGAPLAAHPGVDKVAFTGSTEVGKLLVKAAAGNLKKLTLELGGKSPNIILADADVKRAARAAASAVFYNQGQMCYRRVTHLHRAGDLRPHAGGHHQLREGAPCGGGHRRRGQLRSARQPGAARSRVRVSVRRDCRRRQGAHRRRAPRHGRVLLRADGSRRHLARHEGPDRGDLRPRRRHHPVRG